MVPAQAIQIRLCYHSSPVTTKSRTTIMRRKSSYSGTCYLIKSLSKVHWAVIMGLVWVVFSGLPWLCDFGSLLSGVQSTALLWPTTNNPDHHPREEGTNRHGLWPRIWSLWRLIFSRHKCLMKRWKELYKRCAVKAAIRRARRRSFFKPYLGCLSTRS